MSEIKLEYWPLQKCIDSKWEDNPREGAHDLGSLCVSIEKYGFRDALEFDSTVNRLVAGHGRVEALQGLKQRGKQAWTKHWPPQYINLDEDGKEWLVPVIIGAASDSPEDALGYCLDNNNITMQSGSFTPYEISKIYNQEQYAKVLAKLHKADALPVTVDEDDLQYFLERYAREINGSDEPPAENPKEQESNPLEFILEFDTKEQKEKWLDFLDYLRHEFPNENNHAARLIEHANMVL